MYPRAATTTCAHGRPLTACAHSARPQRPPAAPARRARPPFGAALVASAPAERTRERLVVLSVLFLFLFSFFTRADAAPPNRGPVFARARRGAAGKKNARRRSTPRARVARVQSDETKPRRRADQTAARARPNAEAAESCGALAALFCFKGTQPDTGTLLCARKTV